MHYEICYLAMDLWQRHAIAHNRDFAQAIADMLKAQGHTVRIDVRRQVVTLGEIQLPNDKLKFSSPRE